MKKRYLNKGLLCLVLLLPSFFVKAQCPAGASTAQVNWDHLDFLSQTGTYAGFVSTGMMQNQRFTIGRNKLSVGLSAFITTTGENTTNTAEAGSYGAGADVSFDGRGPISFSFDAAVYNLRFSLYDIDGLHNVTITALDASGQLLTIDASATAAGVITVNGSGTTQVIATASATALGNTDTRGTLNVNIAGSSPAGARGIKSLTIETGFGRGGNGNFWLSDLTACVFGSFPEDYYLSQKPWAGQPAYYLVTPDNNSVYLVNPLTGKCDWLFSEPNSPWVNSMAYDHVNKIVYYVMDHTSPVSTNKSLKKYDCTSETISTVIPDITALGIPIFDIVVESAGAAFYDGSLYLGIEGTNDDKTSNRESIVWRIDFDANQQPVSASQVFARIADNGNGLLMHDWGDFTIKDGMLYDFNTGNSGPTSEFVHFYMQSGNAAVYNTNGSPAPIQAGQTWDGKLYWTGGQSPENGRIALYNENGTIGAKVSTTVTPCSPPWVRRAGDASEPYRPKSDFGDAPDTYDPVPIEKATHEYDCNLRLGPSFDREWDKTPSPLATADGTDEDGITVVNVLAAGNVNHIQAVTVYNNTGSPATLAGWLDYNGNGVFEPAEGRVITVPSNTAMQTCILSWPGIYVPITPGASTFLRVRLTSAANGMTANNPTRWFANGEVEDYRVIVDLVLPVQLLEFSAFPTGNESVLLHWRTSRETNAFGFEVERSKDGRTWEKIGELPAKADGSLNNIYQLYDNEPLTGKSFYRLKMVASSGPHKYSDNRVIELERGRTNWVRVVPNPVRDVASLQYHLEQTGNISIEITDASGKVIFSRKVSASKGINNLALPEVKKMAPGVYAVQLVLASARMSAKMVVQ
ncbi:MAG TPA: GEVED domain-containing protein [Flavisolibacter sp.]|nr:GEVED domain-containing protein [Flavisolibacter sp.]